ncbi:MAG: hypothetical protein IPH59_16160 [bacterium]|nr:hypothetical protein [bacterium]
MATNSELRYDFWDILKAPRMALSGKCLLAQAQPLAFGYAAYLVFAYLALLVDGQQLSSVWSQFRLFPVLSLGLEHWVQLRNLDCRNYRIHCQYDYGNLTVAKLGFRASSRKPLLLEGDAANDARSNLMPMWVSGGVGTAFDSSFNAGSRCSQLGITDSGNR